MRLYHLKRRKVSFVGTLIREDISRNRLFQEAKMSIRNDQLMTNNHEGVLAHLGETLHTWRTRQIQRRELMRWTERDLHDVGISWSEMLAEAEKPFWRA